MLRYVQINSFYNGSTGMIMRNLHQELLNQGSDSYIFWGRHHKSINDHEECCASKRGVYLHGILSRLTDRSGFYSKQDTRKLLLQLSELNPDIVHLHNIHGYYLNINLLFEWLEHHHCKVKWTLHDCWAFTGHCPYFTHVQCKHWESGCHDCPQLHEYPNSLFIDASKRNYFEKKITFNRIPVERMTLITPSRWLAGLVKKSFLRKYEVEVRYNTIDAAQFKPTSSDFRLQHALTDRLVVLGVASPWSQRKGLDDFIRLATDLPPERYSIVLVGVNKKQMKVLPDRVVALPRTNNVEELVSIYSAADIFFSPTREDNYPTVNLEAQACGTPVLTYDVGGCKETLTNIKSQAVPNYEAALAYLQQLPYQAEGSRSPQKLEYIHSDPFIEKQIIHHEGNLS